jgi:hypothetical protein
VIWSSIFDTVMSVLDTALTLLPTLGCGSISLPTINLGWATPYVNVTLLASTVGIILGVEGGLMVYRVLWWVRRWL